jgi:hypothetical protein
VHLGDGDVDGWEWSGARPRLPAVTIAEIAARAGVTRPAPGAPATASPPVPTPTRTPAPTATDSRAAVTNPGAAVTGGDAGAVRGLPGADDDDAGRASTNASDASDPTSRAGGPNPVADGRSGRSGVAITQAGLDDASIAGDTGRRAHRDCRAVAICHRQWEQQLVVPSSHGGLGERPAPLPVETIRRPLLRWSRPPRLPRSPPPPRRSFPNRARAVVVAPSGETTPLNLDAATAPASPPWPAMAAPPSPPCSRDMCWSPAADDALRRSRPMTPTRGDARAWLAWALAGGAVATASRNPIVLGLLLLVTWPSGSACPALGDRPRLATNRRLVLRLAGLSIVFNLATVRWRHAAADPADRLALLGGVLTSTPSSTACWRRWRCWQS